MSWRGFFAGALCAVTMAAGGVSGCWLIHSALPFPDVVIVAAKIDRLATHHDEYDTLFLGSSRIYYQIIPSLFDRLAAAAGLPTRSFNAAVAGMRPPEDSFVLDTILQHPPSHLRWVFIELAQLRTPVDPDKIGTVRAVYWHDWTRLRVLWERALVGKPWRKKHKIRDFLVDRREQFGEFSDHLLLFFRNQANLGRGSALLASRLIRGAFPARSTGDIALGKNLDGWIPTGRPENIEGRELEEYEKSIAARRREPAVKEYGDPVSQKALETMLRKVEKLGATPVLIVPPTTAKHNFHPPPEREARTLVLDFSDLNQYPELYENRYRLDTDHLNTAGAEVFTRLLVQRWAEELKARR